MVPNCGFFRVIDIADDMDHVLCVNNMGVLYKIPIDDIVSVKQMVSEEEYKRLQMWFLLSSICLN